MTDNPAPARRDPRVSTFSPGSAWVEFGYPNANGRRLRMALLDISVSGLSFSVKGDLPLVVPGAQFEDVIVRVGDCEIHGHFVVKHIALGGPEVACGGMFYPKAVPDLLKLNGVIAGAMARAS
jgi:hypothetical protein